LTTDYNLEIKKDQSLSKIIDHYQPKLLFLLEKNNEKILIKSCWEEKKEFSVEKEKIVD
jgi:hypothetical protein